MKSWMKSWIATWAGTMCLASYQAFADLASIAPISIGLLGVVLVWLGWFLKGKS